MSTNGVLIKDKEPRNLRTWAIVRGTCGDSYLVNLRTAAALDPIPSGPSLGHSSLCFLGVPCFFREAYAYIQNLTLAPGSDPSRGIVTGVQSSRIVLPLGLYGKSVGIGLIPSTLTLLEHMPDDVIEALSSQVDQSDALDASVQKGSPRIQLAHGPVPRQ
jgi:hypothetical protein